MATLNFLDGSFRGKLGNVIGSSWKGKPYVKAYAKTGNPKTEKQVAVREVFSKRIKAAQLGLALSGKKGFFDTSQSNEFNLRQTYAHHQNQAGKNFIDWVYYVPGANGITIENRLTRLSSADGKTFRLGWVSETPTMPPADIIACCTASGDAGLYKDVIAVHVASWSRLVAVEYYVSEPFQCPNPISKSNEFRYFGYNKGLSQNKAWDKYSDVLTGYYGLGWLANSALVWVNAVRQEYFYNIPFDTLFQRYYDYNSPKIDSVDNLHNTNFASCDEIGGVEVSQITYEYNQTVPYIFIEARINASANPSLYFCILSYIAGTAGNQENDKLYVDFGDMSRIATGVYDTTIDLSCPKNLQIKTMRMSVFTLNHSNNQITAMSDSCKII